MKALVLFSGGLDSTVCLAVAVKEYGAENVTALSVYYGQKHKKELEAAEKITAFYGVKRMSLDLREIFKDSTCSLLESSKENIPQGDYADQLEEKEGKPVDTYVPFRNGLFISSAASIALSLGCDVIYYGIHADDAAGNAYPDTGVDFNEAMSKAVFLGSGKQLKVISPFVDTPKAEIVRCGIELGVPFEMTWSCYEGGERPCGKCGTCIDRKKAFAANGMEDPA